MRVVIIVVCGSSSLSYAGRHHCRMRVVIIVSYDGLVIIVVSGSSSLLYVGRHHCRKRVVIIVVCGSSSLLYAGRHHCHKPVVLIVIIVSYAGRPHTGSMWVRSVPSCLTATD